ncbi:MAG: hypothetical protein U0S76_07995, partial [Pseudoxanthomonas sp.]|nr:hypothetical protein [Pseudoxanthomonas sp.]
RLRQLMNDPFSAFLATLREETSRTALSPVRLAEALELPIQKLATLARVHRSTVGLSPTSSKLQEAMGDVVRVLSAAHDLSDDLDTALFWFRNQPIPEFDHYTPLQLVEQGKVQALIDYIYSIRSGASG